jgi:hypothetical protein
MLARMKTLRQKSDPLPKGHVDIHIDLPRPLRDWAKRQPAGVSALLYRLLKEERTRRCGVSEATGMEVGS